MLRAGSAGLSRWVFLLLAVLAGNAFGGEAVDFQLQGADGATYRLSDYRGRWVVVNYWATWCPPCLEEIPELVDFHERHKDDDAIVLGVNFEDIGDRWLQEFLDDQLINYPILKGRPGGRTELGPVPGLPTTYIVSPEGVPVARQVGPVTAEMLDAYISKKKAAPQARAGAVKTAGQ